MIVIMAFVEMNGWFLINNSVLWWAADIDAKYINLSATKWEDMVYGKADILFINYPWEYDIEGMFIKVFADKTGRLNYILEWEGKKTFAIVQSPSALDHEEIVEAKTIYYTDDAVEKILDKMEVEAKRERLVRKQEESE